MTCLLTYVTIVAVILAVFIGSKRNDRRTDPDPCDCRLLCEHECWDDPDEFTPAGGWP